MFTFNNPCYPRAVNGDLLTISLRVGRFLSASRGSYIGFMPQLLLFPDPRPLVERLGREFFRQLPETPGVYLMHGVAEVVLYVGKAKSLRHRLNSYRVANPERLARRTLRLLRLVERIGWETCVSEDAALKRESELLLALKPRFNRAGVWRGPDRFLGWRAVQTGLELVVTDTPEEGWDWVGPFGTQAVYLHQALVRPCWCQFNPARGLAGMPSGWWCGNHGPKVFLQHHNPAFVLAQQMGLMRLAAGDPHWLTTLPPVRAVFETTARDDDLECVAKYLVGRGLANGTSPVSAPIAGFQHFRDSVERVALQSVVYEN